MYRLVLDGVRTVPAREPDRRDQHLRRGQLAPPSDPHVESRVPLRVRRRAQRNRGSHQLRIRLRQRQLRASARHGVDVAGHDRLAVVPDWQRRRRRVAAWRLRHLPRSRVPIGLLAERRQPAHQSANRTRARRSPRCLESSTSPIPTLGFVFVPGPQTIRHSITIAADDLGMPYTHQWSATYERKLPWSSSLRVSYNGNHGVGTLRYSLANLPLSPLDGPVTVANHPNNAPAAGFPDLRGKVIDRLAADQRCAGTGLPSIAVNAACPVPVPIADNEISTRVPRTNERRPGSSLLVEPRGQQRRRVVVRRAPDRVGEAAQPGPDVHDQLHAQQARRTRRRKRRSSAPATRTSWARTRFTPRAIRASTRRIGSRSTAATCCRSGRTGRA